GDGHRSPLRRPPAGAGRGAVRAHGGRVRQGEVHLVRRSQGRPAPCTRGRCPGAGPGPGPCKRRRGQGPGSRLIHGANLDGGRGSGPADGRWRRRRPPSPAPRLDTCPACSSLDPCIVYFYYFAVRTNVLVISK
uniref:Uncharacterized protein n=1 Tax=Aegilops tauschii subsp. strangulata TaxID=200361 RepID=A0A453QH09_AEGTS